MFVLNRSFNICVEGFYLGLDLGLEAEAKTLEAEARTHEAEAEAKTLEAEAEAGYFGLEAEAGFEAGLSHKSKKNICDSY